MFPDEYAIPLWSANVFPYVTRAAVETMRKLRYCADKTKGIEIINTFRSQLSSQVRSVDVDETGIEAIDVDATTNKFTTSRTTTIAARTVHSAATICAATAAATTTAAAAAAATRSIY